MINDIVTYNSSIGEIIEPDIIAYSFNTLGWQIVALLLLIAALLIVVKQYLKYKKNAYRRKAIEDINIALKEDNSNKYEAINTILKSICLKLYNRREVASLFGSEWFSFLNSKTDDKPDSLQLQQQFTEAIYSSKYNNSSEISEAFTAFATNWVKKHKA